jgi:hypothetical protein
MSTDRLLGRNSGPVVDPLGAFFGEVSSGCQSTTSDIEAIFHGLKLAVCYNGEALKRVCGKGVWLYSVE